MTTRILKLLVLAVALVATVGPVAGAGWSAAAELSESQFWPLAKTGTSWGAGNEVGPQGYVWKALASRVSFRAEGMGFEPTTPFGAPDFESGRWPIRLPSWGEPPRAVPTGINRLGGPAGRVVFLNLSPAPGSGKFVGMTYVL